VLIGLVLLLSGLSLPQGAAPGSAQANTLKSDSTALAAIDPEIAAKLLSLKRIYIEPFGDDKESQQLQAMVIDSLVATKRFIVTENKDKAEAILKGVGLEKTSQELHAIGEGTSVARAAGGSSGSVSGSVINGNGSVSGSSHGGFSSGSAAINDSQASITTVNDARLAVRLTAADGDVLWSTTQESKGAKYKGASADVADLVVKQLIRDLDRLTAKMGKPDEAVIKAVVK
jgi:curli biogenesis system outer membrane secretion channel CsgG